MKKRRAVVVAGGGGVAAAAAAERRRRTCLSFCLDKMENPLPALCAFIRYTKRSSACGSILLFLAFFQRTNNKRAPPSRFSPLNLSSIAFIMPQRKSTHVPSALRFRLNFCAVVSPFSTGRNFFFTGQP